MLNNCHLVPSHVYKTIKASGILIAHKRTSRCWIGNSSISGVFSRKNSQETQWICLKHIINTCSKHITVQHHFHHLHIHIMFIKYHRITTSDTSDVHEFPAVALATSSDLRAWSDSSLERQAGSGIKPLYRIVPWCTYLFMSSSVYFYLSIYLSIHLSV